MSYVKTNWQNDQAPAINATNLNKIENGIFNNDAIITSIMTTLGINATTWVSTNTYVEGDSVVYNNKLYKNITGDYTTTDPATDTTNWMKTTMLDIQYPVGKTEIFYDDLDHTNYLGFTWEKYAAGRCLVGKDTTQTEFDTLGETGGSKYLQAHTHNGLFYQVKDGASSGNDGGVYAGRPMLKGNSVSSNTTGWDSTSAGTGDAGNLQPYIVVNIWKRVS